MSGALRTAIGDQRPDGSGIAGGCRPVPEVAAASDLTSG